VRLATPPVTGVNAQPELGRDSMNRAPAIQTPKEHFSLVRLVLQVLLSPRSIDHNMPINHRVLRRCLEFKGSGSRAKLGLMVSRVAHR
jgi:hypothetical protein